MNKIKLLFIVTVTLFSIFNYNFIFVSGQVSCNTKWESDSGTFSFSDRSDVYKQVATCIRNLDNEASDIKFFSAAESVTGIFFLGGVEWSPDCLVSEDAEDFLQRLSANLYNSNIKIARKIINDPIFIFDPNNTINKVPSSFEFDMKMVEFEQSLVQQFIIEETNTNSNAFSIFSEINQVLNINVGNDCSFVPNWLPDVFKPEILIVVAEYLGRDIDFTIQEHREAIGKALIFELRRCTTLQYQDYMIGEEHPSLSDGYCFEQSDSGNLLDLIFVIDTTGSMEDDIDQVKANALDIINQVASNSANWQIGIVLYRDYGPPYGLENDEYLVKRELEFSSNRDDVANAIRRITIRVGAGDAEEAVYSGLMEAISFPWRNGAQKVIILMGDAPPHNPEPFSNYTSQTVLQAAYDVDPASIYPILIQSENAVRFPFQVLADGSSGRLFYASNADEVVATLLSTIDVATGVNLSVGLNVQIASLDPDFPIRTSASMRATVIRNIPRSEQATIIAGPEVVFQMSDRNIPQNFIWWQIQTETGTEGWMQGTYYGEPILVPFSEANPIMPITCTLSTFGDINIRSGPGTEYQQIASRAGANQILAANGQSGNISRPEAHWWQLINGFWVRNDQVRETGDCASLPTVNAP